MRLLTVLGGVVLVLFVDGHGNDIVLRTFGSRQRAELIRSGLDHGVREGDQYPYNGLSRIDKRFARVVVREEGRRGRGWGRTAVDGDDHVGDSVEIDDKDSICFQRKMGWIGCGKGGGAT